MRQPADRSEASKVYLEVGDHERAMQVALEADRLVMVGAWHVIPSARYCGSSVSMVIFMMLQN